MRRLAALAPFALLACSSSPSVDHAARSRAPIIHGVVSDASQNDVVLVVHDDGSGSIDTCTGEIIAPNLILTARHCVSVTSDAAMYCGVDGLGDDAGVIGADYPPSTLTVYVGVNYPADTAPPDGKGAKILHDDATNLCNHDLAMILLAAPIPGAQIAPLRLDDTTKKGELFTAVGWGVTDKTFDPPQRMQRTGIPILAVGPDTTEDIPPNELEVGESICSGDSGGPALSAAGAVIAIVSRGGNGTGPSSTVPGVDCEGSGTYNDYTRVAPFKSLILDAFSQAGYSPVLEGSTPDAGTDDTGTTDSGATTDDSGTSTGDDTGAPVVDSGTGASQTPQATQTTTTASCAMTTNTPENKGISLFAVAVGLAFAARRRRQNGQ